MDQLNKRGKIPQQDWPAIMARYEAGETLASIARSYDCSPPAISYIVSRSRARGVAPNAIGSRAASEPQLIKSDGIEMTVGESAASLAASSETPTHELESADRDQAGAGVTAPPVPVAAPGAANSQHDDSLDASGEEGRGADSERHDEKRDNEKRDDVPPTRASVPGDGTTRDHRPPGILHLSHPDRNQAPAAAEQSDDGSRKPIASDPSVAPDATLDHRDRVRFNDAGHGRVQPSGNGAHGGPVHERPDNHEGGAFIDVALRQRVQADIAAFLTAFDAALNRDTSETRAELRQATDRLLRAGARTRIELERLEARIRLPARNDERSTVSAWRQR
jgi:hypothetical protein